MPNSVRVFAYMRRHYILTMVLGTLIYGLLALISPNVPFLAVLRASQFVCGAAVVMSLWWTVAALWYEGDNVKEEHVYTIGTFITRVGILGEGLWLCLFRVADEPLWMINSPVSGYFVALMVTGCILEIAGPWAVHGIMPYRAIKILAWASVSVSLLFGASLMFHDNVRWLAGFLRPYMSEVTGDPEFLGDSAK